MPRRARVVVRGVGHDVTQRGTGRQFVFYTRADPRFVLDLDFWAESDGRQRWAALRAGADEKEQMKLLIRATHAGNPLGSNEFQEQIRAIRAQREAARRGEGLGFGDEPYPSAELLFAAV